MGAMLAVAAAAIYSVYIIVGAQVMKHVSAVQSSAVILAAMWLNETPAPLTLLGGGLIMFAVLLQTRSELTHTNSGLMRKQGSGFEL